MAKPYKRILDIKRPHNKSIQPNRAIQRGSNRERNETIVLRYKNRKTFGTEGFLVEMENKLERRLLQRPKERPRRESGQKWDVSLFSHSAGEGGLPWQITK